MIGDHVRVECKHGALIRQCRCTGKPVRVESPCPPSCEADQMPEPVDLIAESGVTVLGVPVPYFELEALAKKYASTDLDGATEPGNRAAYASTPGEFAARWNAMSEEGRAGFVQAMSRASERASLCLMVHDGRRFV